MNRHELTLLMFLNIILNLYSHGKWFFFMNLQTDTASVLDEASISIKFLQDQIQVPISTSFLYVFYFHLFIAIYILWHRICLTSWILLIPTPNHCTLRYSLLSFVKIILKILSKFLLLIYELGFLLTENRRETTWSTKQRTLFGSAIIYAETEKWRPVWSLIGFKKFSILRARGEIFWNNSHMGESY